MAFVILITCEQSSIVNGTVPWDLVTKFDLFVCGRKKRVEIFKKDMCIYIIISVYISERIKEDASILCYSEFDA